MGNTMSSIFLALMMFAHLLCLGTGQGCDEGGGGGGFVGFTALTPEQLTKTIRDSVLSSVSDALPPLDEKDSDDGDCCFGLFALNDTLNELVERTSRLERTIEATVYSAVVNTVTAVVESALSEVVLNLTRVVRQIDKGSPTLPPPPSPAASCKQIYNINSTSPSGFYWITGGEGPPRRLYCDMARTCGGVAGGWTRVANIDMTNGSHSCPPTLEEISLDPKTPRLCAISDTSVGCTSTVFPVHGISYEHVCGRIIGYQHRTPNAFFPYHINQGLTIDDPYIDGVSVTHGIQPRRHIWSFASALDESDGHQSGCPCLNIESNSRAEIPPFVGSDYFCDTGSSDDVQNIFYPDNPLWDGDGCGRLNTCCSFNNPPWFSKTLDCSASDDIEMRICRDAGRLNEEVPIELVELYIR